MLIGEALPLSRKMSIPNWTAQNARHDNEQVEERAPSMEGGLCLSWGAAASEQGRACTPLSSSVAATLDLRPSLRTSGIAL